MGLVGIPRSNAALGVMKYSNAFFHPKTYHLRRADGSQAAYVGSANLTPQGLALHVEAGILLDTRTGDSDTVLNDIAAAVDAWFTNTPAGFHLVDDRAVIDQLAAEEVLLLTPPPRPPRSSTGGSVAPTASLAHPTLQTMMTLPTFASTVAPQPQVPVPGSSAAPPTVATPHAGFPQYLLFDPSATTPTQGAGALTGATLPSDATGLIIRLNRDSARHFAGRPGTANISIPVATISTLRFGLYQGKYQRPRAEYRLLLRYIGQGGTIAIAPVNTNIMAYGFALGETGHGDIRMLVPVHVRALTQQVTDSGMPVPVEGNLAILEWPTTASPDFRLTFLEPVSQLYQQAAGLFATAEAASQLVGDGACWLPAGLSPTW